MLTCLVSAHVCVCVVAEWVPQLCDLLVMRTDDAYQFALKTHILKTNKQVYMLCMNVSGDVLLAPRQAWII